tara:strand:+ start:3658 stop:3930 length:273 start_codon:yes stop_codon:yes gene_type:complete
MQTILNIEDDRHHIARLVALYARRNGLSAISMVEHPLDERSVVKVERGEDVVAATKILSVALDEIVRDLDAFQVQLNDQLDAQGVMVTEG